MARRNLDFIGNLPDFCLLQIISLLPYKEAARTSILSKRWRHILPTTPNVIDLNEQKGTIPSHFFAEIAPTRMTENRHQKPPQALDKLSLTLSKPEDFVDGITSCIALAVQRKAKVILLDFSNPTWDEINNGDYDVYDIDEIVMKFDLPLSVYGLKTLETLKLFSCNFDASMFKSFVSLRHLSLGWIELSSSSLKTLVENCESLESLSLKRCWSTEIIEIRGPGLRLESLRIDRCNVVHGLITIEASNLRVFKYWGKFCVFELNSTRRIEEVVLDFGLQSEFGEVGPLLFELFRDFYAATVLTVCSFVLQAIPTGEEPLGLKPHLNVKHLILKSAMHENELYGVRFFLNSCPHLETLTIDINPAKKIFEDYEPPFKERWTQNLPIYKCLVRTLKVVETKGYRGSRNQFYFLLYLISFGYVMEKLNINVSKEAGDGESREMYLQRAQMLQTLKRASPSLIISIC